MIRPCHRHRALVGLVLAAGCGGAGPVPESGAPGAASLAGTSWRLVEFQSSDDAIGIQRPADPDLYTLELGEGGALAMRLDCNRGSGSWSATPDGPEAGALSLGTVAVTRAFCPPPSLGDQIARHAEYVRSYILRDGRLYLSLMADGGIYVWEPIPGSN